MFFSRFRTPHLVTLSIGASLFLRCSQAPRATETLRPAARQSSASLSRLCRFGRQPTSKRKKRSAHPGTHRAIERPMKELQIVVAEFKELLKNHKEPPITVILLYSWNAFAQLPSKKTEEVPQVLLVSHYVYVEAGWGHIQSASSCGRSPGHHGCTECASGLEP